MPAVCLEKSHQQVAHGGVVGELLWQWKNNPSQSSQIPVVDHVIDVGHVHEKHVRAEIRVAPPIFLQAMAGQPDGKNCVRSKQGRDVSCGAFQSFYRQCLRVIPGDCILDGIRIVAA